jgi:hypothetical protein
MSFSRIGNRNIISCIIDFYKQLNHSLSAFSHAISQYSLLRYLWSIFQLFFQQGDKDGGWVSAAACFFSIIQSSSEDLLIKSAGRTAVLKPACNIAKAGPVGLIFGLDNFHQFHVEIKGTNVGILIRPRSNRSRKRRRLLCRIRTRIRRIFIFFSDYVSFPLLLLCFDCAIFYRRP